MPYEGQHPYVSHALWGTASVRLKCPMRDDIRTSQMPFDPSLIPNGMGRSFRTVWWLPLWLITSSPVRCGGSSHDSSPHLHWNGRSFRTVWRLPLTTDSSSHMAWSLLWLIIPYGVLALSHGSSCWLPLMAGSLSCAGSISRLIVPLNSSSSHISRSLS